MSNCINVVVEKRDYETMESLINRFRRTVDSENVLKDHKLNVILSRTERKQFKKFASQRRNRKKVKRVATAMRG
jgi:hypothetical protein